MSEQLKALKEIHRLAAVAYERVLSPVDRALGGGLALILTTIRDAALEAILVVEPDYTLSIPPPFKLSDLDDADED